MESGELTNKELQEILKKYPDNIPVYLSTPVEGDSENVEKPCIIFDIRYPALVIL